MANCSNNASIESSFDKSCCSIPIMSLILSFIVTAIVELEYVIRLIPANNVINKVALPVFIALVILFDFFFLSNFCCFISSSFCFSSNSCCFCSNSCCFCSKAYCLYPNPCCSSSSFAQSYISTSLEASIALVLLY